MRNHGFRRHGLFVRVVIAALLTGSAANAALAQAEFRAFWADAFHDGYKSTAQIDAMVSRAVAGNYNAIIAEVLAYHDNVGGAHGAYWNSSIVPKAPDISGDIDPLAYLLQQAHANGIEVHCWLVAFRVSTNWPPSGNATVAAHPEWLMVPQAAMGGGPAPVGSAYQFDPGSPDVQEYLMSIVRELITNYEIDGIHWDYIRYTQNDAGYPADTTYARSGLARFQQITGRSDTPSVDDSQWNDFRRRTIDEVVVRCRAEVPSIPNPRQPLRHTAALICFGDAPANFTSSSAYNLYQNWRHWMEQGWLDAAIPMNYKREHNTSQAAWYRNWVDAAMGWRYDRHMFLGQAVYLNSMANSVTQMQYGYNAGGDGSVNYSYYATADNNLDGNWENDWSWYTSYCPTNMFTSPAALPSMPWRDPATATEGTLWGQVTGSSSGLPVDDATVQVGGLGSVQTDGNGYYVKTLVPAAAGGTDYDVTADKAGYSVTIHPDVTVLAGDIQRQDFVLDDVVLPPIIAEVTPDPDTIIEGQEYTVQLFLTQGTADSWTLVQGPAGAIVNADGRISGWIPVSGDVGQLFDFTVRATNTAGSHDESWQVLVEPVPTCSDAILSDFEGYPNGTEVMFRQPSFSGSTSRHLAPSPNVREVTDEVNAVSGTKSYKLQWQFVDGADDRWVRITTFNAANVPNPTIALDGPVRVRLRLDSGSLRVSLGIRETGTTADVGENGGTSGSIEWIGAETQIDLAPQGKLISAQPGVWQTFVFDPAVDPILGFTGDGTLSTPTNKGTIEHLAFSSTGQEGPYTLYIDDVEQLCAAECVDDIDCDDGNECTIDACNETTGTCDNILDDDDGDGVGNLCDDCPNTIAGVTVDLFGCPPEVPGDFDRDGDVDEGDFDAFLSCTSGPYLPLASGCENRDFDGDNDADQADFGHFQRCISGGNVPADPNCAD